MATAFSANLNKIALLRNSRGGSVPDVRWAAGVCLEQGARGVTLHPRPDQRHARPDDVQALRELTRARAAELNIEGYPHPAFVDLVCAVRPDQVTLVPDTATQLTSDHGWPLDRAERELPAALSRLRQAGLRISLFMDPDPAPLVRIRALGVDRIELYTEPWAKAHAAGQPGPVLTRYAATARAAQAVGLGVNAGHDLTLDNLGALLAGVPGIAEVSIGHRLIADALDLGLAEAVRRYVAICNS